ncbi:MACPF domain-containing protein 2 [Elysia marginata]|uniref:MACPF domain-containing protein 2 n=1 Tax=Elysia marginata TaxID=1093978 RepID=A0AAV4EPK1_9GAST|nr:MACPF domain-containing protein 2 [Elysia marginata]
MASATLLLCLLFILPGQVFGFVFELTSSRKELNFLYEETLQIECSFNPQHSDHDSEILSIQEIHIIKRDDSKRWTEVAKLQLNGYLTTSDNNLQAYGEIGSSVNVTFLKVIWEKATPEELAMYRCDVVALDENFDYDIYKSNFLTIFKHNVTTEELLDLSQRQLDNLQLEFNKFKKSTAKKMAQLEKSVHELKNESESGDDSADDDVPSIDVDQLKEEILTSVLTNVSLELENMTCSRLSSCMLSQLEFLGDLDEFEEKTTITDGTTTSVTTTSATTPTTTLLTTLLTTTPPTTTTTLPPTTTTLPPTTTTVATQKQLDIPWPTGPFALMRTSSGCPVTPKSPYWETGYNKYHTESVDENHDNVTTPNHLATPTMEEDQFGNHFLYMHFCVSLNRNPVNLRWPAGAYCINMAGSGCPAGFDSGYIDVDEEDDNFAGRHAGVLPVMLYYCCRNDGPADKAIILPNAKPFYLYRFGGQCQNVYNMEVTPERMLFDTENNQNEDVFENDIHPDGKNNDLVIELCYYS